MTNAAWLRVSIATLVLNFALTAAAQGESYAEESYKQAAEAKRVAAYLVRSLPPADLKNSLLTETRDADKGYAKSILLHWKENSAITVQAEFNVLIVRSHGGDELLRMAPSGNDLREFRVNGQTWRRPDSGSVAESLRHTLRARNAGASLFDLVAAQAFADSVDPAQTAAYLYATAAERHLLRDETSVSSLIWDVIARNPVKVHCAADAASGHVKLAGENVAFTVLTKENATLLTPVESGITFKVIASGNTGLNFFACADKACTKTVGPAKTTLAAFMDVQDGEAVDTATTFRPRDGDTESYPIERRCESKADCRYLEIQNLKKLSARDQLWAVKYRDDANLAIAKQDTQNNEVIRAILPLGQCCKSTSCRRSVLTIGIDLAPNGADGSGAGATNHPKAITN